VSMSRLGRTAGLVAAVAVLAGCGNVNPGVAVKVDDESVTVREVDDLAADYCDVLSPDLQGNSPPQVLPLGYLRSGIAGLLGQRMVAEQLAAEYDVEPGATYDDAMVQLEARLRGLDEDVREATKTVESASAYVQAIQIAVGAQLLEEAGGTDATQDTQLARGQEAFADWVADNDVEFDPEFGVDLVDGVVQPVDSTLSVPVGEGAKAAATRDASDQDYATSLPAAHTCD